MKATLNSYFKNSRPEMLRYIPANTRCFLDVGCGAGYFAESIKCQIPDSEVWGIEAFRNAGAQAEARIDRVIIAPAEQAIHELPNQYFDCVFFNDSLEHFLDPYSLLSTIRQKMKPGATIIASIPNIRHYKVLADLLIRKEWRYTDAGVLDKTHFRFFTSKSMRRMFEDAGFTILKLEGLRASRKVKVRIWGWLSFGALDDIRFSQFVIVARVP